MKYRISSPLDGSAGNPRLDIVNPAWSPESRALAQHGLGDVEAPTNAVLLTLFDDRRDEFSFVDVGAGIGVSSLLCAELFRPARVVAVQPCEQSASMLRRIAAANDLDIDVQTELSEALDEVAASPNLVVRVGRTVEAVDALTTIAFASGDRVPPVVIVGDRDRTTLLRCAKATGYLVYPLRRYPSWRPLHDDTDTTRADGWLLVDGAIADGLREQHSVWAGALGACTPDRSDRPPLLAELRAGFHARHGGAELLADARRDLARSARAIWHGMDPWLPPSRSRPGRVIRHAVALARRMLPLSQGG